MLGFGKADPYADPELGVLTRKSGKWEGVIALGGHPEVPLFVEGGREAPDAGGLALARDLTRRFDELRPAIAVALFEHYEPYRDPVVAGEETDPDLVMMSSVNDVWPHAEPVAVLIQPLRGSPEPGPIIEIQYRVVWDEEHTLGARIQGWRVFEMCGSV